MRIAVVSDIHGNLEALLAVWSDIAQLEVTRVVSLGDMIGYGPNPEEVLVFLREHDVQCCLGNHELGIAFRNERRWFNLTARKGLNLTESLLSAESLSYIAGLPRFRIIEGARCVHGYPPESVTTYLFQVPDERLETWFHKGERLVFVGHTHELAWVRWNGAEVERRKLERGCTMTLDAPSLVNVGSVGQPRDGNNNAKYLIWDTETGTLDVRFVRYDIERTVAKIRERGFPEYYASRLW